MPVDFHTHTLFSIDSFGTPEELVESAKACGITALSVTDHNCLNSSKRAAVRAKDLGVRYFPGVEYDVFFDEYHCHILGLGIDPENADIKSIAKTNYACYETQFEFYYSFLKEKGFPWTREEIFEQLPFRYPTHPAPILSVGLLYHFIGYKDKREEYEDLWKEADSRYSNLSPEERASHIGSFCSFTDTIEAIKSAGGLSLLAHVAKCTSTSFVLQKKLIIKMLDKGLSGFELYHPANIDLPWFKELEEFGRTIGCVLSGGSDYHGVTPYGKRKDYRFPHEMSERLISALSNTVRTAIQHI